MKDFCPKNAGQRSTPGSQLLRLFQQHLLSEDEERTPEWTAKSYKLLRAKYGVPPTELPPLAVERDGALSNGSKLSSVSLPKVPPEKDPGILSR